MPPPSRRGSEIRVLDTILLPGNVFFTMAMKMARTMTTPMRAPFAAPAGGGQRATRAEEGGGEGGAPIRPRQVAARASAFHSRQRRENGSYCPQTSLRGPFTVDSGQETVSTCPIIRKNFTLYSRQRGKKRIVYNSWVSDGDGY